MKQNRFFKSFFMLAVVLTLVTTSCTDTLFSKEVAEDGGVQVTCLIGQEAPEMVLRANIADPTAAEYLINTMTIFAFNKSNGSYVNKADIDPTQAQIDNLNYQYTTGTIESGRDYVFVVVANMGNAFDSFSGSLSTLKETMLTATGLPSTPFVMYGETDVINLNKHTPIKINLKRVAFAVSISSRAEGFVLENEWYLYNGETNGYIAKDPSTVTGFTSNLAASGKLETRQKAYSYPRNAMVTKDNETYVIFKGLYNGVSSYYRVALNKKSGKQEFLSNRLYLLDIVKVVGVGYATLEEAKAAEADKTVVFTVSDWDDTNSSDAVFFGHYFISTERVFFEFDRALQQSSTIIRTNAPSLVLIPPVDRTKALEIPPIYEEARWTTFSLVEAEPDEDPNVRVYRLNVGCFENNKEEREAFGFIRAEGIHSDDLKLRINILQRYDNDYFSDALSLNISPQLFFSNASSQGGEVFTSTITLPIERQAWGIRGVEYFIPELGRYVSVGETDVMAQYPQYEFIESVSNASGAWEWKGTIDESILFEIGDGKVIIKTKQMTPGPRHARVWVQTGRNLIFYNSIGVSQDFYGDYVITYPANVHEDMKRSRYVIETPLAQNSPLEYYIDIKSNSSWSIDIIPEAEADDWVTVEPSSYDYINDVGYGSEVKSQRVKVTVQPNVSIPLMNDDGVYEYPRARSRGLRITYRGNQKDEYSNEYNLILNEQIIDVYQGGYVTIGGEDWLDRNLKSGWRFSEERGGQENQDYPLLYPYANPLGIPVDKYGVYAKDNEYNATLKSNEYGDDGFFICAAEQSGYYNKFAYQYGWVTKGLKYYRLNKRTNRYDKKTALYYSYNFESSDPGVDIYWDQLFANNEDPNDHHPMNPCPPGWTVPYNDNLIALSKAMNKGTTYGKPTEFPYNKYNLSSAGGKMGVKNSGRMLYVANPEVGVDSGWEVPFFLPAAGARLLANSPVDLSGTVGYYKQNEKHKRSDSGSFQGERHQSNAVLIVTQDKVLMGDQNTSEAASIRCVRKKSQP